jgi:hypothetical protein
METYGTCLEEYMEVLVKNKFGDLYCISGWVTLLDAVDDDGKKKLLKIDRKMERLGGGSRREAKKAARTMSRDLIATLRRKIAVNCDSVLLNPAAFQRREFKRMTFPVFCRCLIDHCEIVVGHGDVLDGDIREMILSNMEARKSYAPAYYEQLCKLVKQRNVLWAPGSIDELKHAVNAGKQVLILMQDRLEEADSKVLSHIENSVVPFYPPSRRAYIKLWREPVKNAYQEYCAKTHGLAFLSAMKS